MGLFSPEPPHGFTSEQKLFIIGRPHIPQIDPPQGFEEIVIPPPGMGTALVQTSTLTALVQTGTFTALIQTGTG